MFARVFDTFTNELFGIRGKLRIGAAERRQTNIIRTQKRAHSMKPDELYDIVESCSPGPYMELFARFQRKGWSHWGNEVDLNGSQIKMYPTYRGNDVHNGYAPQKHKRATTATLFEAR